MVGLGSLCTSVLAPVPHYKTGVMELRGRVKVSLSVQLCGMLARVCIDTNDLRDGAYEASSCFVSKQTTCIRCIARY